jgi:protein disulfide-isomerase
MINFGKTFIMKNLTLSLLFISFISFSFSQQKLVWHDNLQEAVKISKKENKPLMLFFTGSDWCGWCIKLQREVFFKPAFKKWANENVVLVELDYPRKKAQPAHIKTQNAQLQRQFNVRGYPTIWFVKADSDSAGQLNLSQLGKTGYVKGGPAAWISEANQQLGGK